ncbi:MAG: hypothetical protein HZA49_02120 [Planctomycetes bacterium]|nr:hypothetical protein [Planctomycetota bacterium]
MKKEVVLSLHSTIYVGLEGYQKLSTKWRRGCIRAAAHINQDRKASVGTKGAFKEKIAKPLLQSALSYLGPMFEYKYGPNAGLMMKKYRQKLFRSAGKYFSKLDGIYETVNGIKAKRYKEAIDRKTSSYLSQAGRFLFPLTVAEYPQKSVVSLAAMALAGYPKIQKRFLKETDKLLAGNSVRITTPQMIGRFKRALNAQIIKYGSQILRFLRALEIVSKMMNKNTGTYGVAWNEVFQRMSEELVDIIKISNQALNETVEKYRRLKKIAPFKEDGDSHINFVLEKQVDRTQEQFSLCLDIQVSMG